MNWTVLVLSMALSLIALCTSIVAIYNTGTIRSTQQILTERLEAPPRQEQAEAEPQTEEPAPSRIRGGETDDATLLMSEITEHVIDPCFAAVTHKTATTEDGEMPLELAKALGEDLIQTMEDDLLPVVSGKPRSARMGIYSVTREYCLKLVRENSQ